ncbi:MULTISPECIES: ribosome small subunit-dependent GTPase A [unclassified Exiguobacterium]|uniref:ribosome small subunit-dependent GTPase A n=1 Tax=unclassified Exiguobacterium TaxID=2644629 RepID=UPI000B592060|nr:MULTISPECIES: ribosome small subunit-dependent GTPase A [unclassified Exiguobacterium]ASI35787.1 ribosome small subunit-dependent GTPase A [Exiguobacterium sp. N4-1P]
MAENRIEENRDGTIIRLQGGFYDVMTTQGEVRSRARGNFRKRGISPVVGDEVVLHIESETGYILEVKERQNFLVRPPVANIDQALLVVSAAEPDFSAHLLDRFLVLIEAKEIQPIIILTKMDLLQGTAEAEVRTAIAGYRQIGYQVIETSSETLEGVEEVRPLLKEKTSVLAGQSGVGKSSLLNALDATLDLETSHISKSLGRGRHTTRHVTLIPLAEGLIADTPGFSNLDFPHEMEIEELRWCFPEFVARQDTCKYRGCLHLNEPGCAVKKSVEGEEIMSSRYTNYGMFVEEIKNRARRY